MPGPPEAGRLGLPSEEKIIKLEGERVLMTLFLLGVVALIALVVSIFHNYKLRRFLQKRGKKTHYLPTVVTTLVMTAQLSELVKAVEHVDFVHICAAIMLLVVIIASKPGTESEDR